ncbi:MAG TPA: bifunctional hydroxymethylpyrimidine kinase/phosphomethylpyrimidine kinase [Actinomycetota bacterium]
MGPPPGVAPAPGPSPEGSPHRVTRPPVALTIAGSDSGGGAGIAADLKTFMALGVHGALAVAALTAQDTCGISAVHPVRPGFVYEQMVRVVTDLGVDAAKTGMLGNERTVRAVAHAAREFGIRRLVVDPVLSATTGRELLAPRALIVMVRHLLPVASLVTPNLAEAGALLGRTVATLPDMREAAMQLHGLGAEAVLVTGGHLEGDPVDVLFDGTEMVELPGPRLTGAGTHGSGCTLSAAITARLAAGAPLQEAVRDAKTFVTEAIRCSLALGRCAGPVNPAWAWDRISGLPG